jgi:hypothetical protein
MCHHQRRALVLGEFCISFNFPSSFYDQIVKTRAATGRAADDDTLGVRFDSSSKFP